MEFLYRKKPICVDDDSFDVAEDPAVPHPTDAASFVKDQDVSATASLPYSADWIGGSYQKLFSQSPAFTNLHTNLKL
jgi:hypothetical protein